MSVSVSVRECEGMSVCVYGYVHSAHKDRKKNLRENAPKYSLGYRIQMVFIGFYAFLYFPDFLYSACAAFRIRK